MNGRRHELMIDFDVAVDDHFQEKPIKLSLIGSNGHSRIYINLQYSTVYAQYLPMPNMSFSFIIRTISTWSDWIFCQFYFGRMQPIANIVSQIWRRLYQAFGSHALQIPYAWNGTMKNTKWNCQRAVFVIRRKGWLSKDSLFWVASRINNNNHKCITI